MMEVDRFEPREMTEGQLLVEVEQLHQEIDRLRQRNQDLELALLTTAEHGDFIEQQLLEANRKLQAEVAERQLAQATLQRILETVTQDKADLELILQTTTAHGDVLEYQLYTQAVETMRQSEELLRAIAESTPILMFLTQTPNGVISYANSTATQQLGVERQELVGRPLCEFYTNPADEAHLQTLMQTQGYVRNHELQVRQANGDALWVCASIYPITLQGDAVLLTTLYDISDRKQAEEELRRSQAELRQQAQQLERRVEQRAIELRQAEAKYRSMFENAVEGIFQITPDGEFISANAALAQIYGYDSPAELMATVTDIGKQLYVQPRRRDELVAYLRRFNAVSEFESQVYRKDGSKVWISENVRVVYDDKGEVTHYEGSVHDITGRKITEDELRQQRQLSERLLLNVLPQRIAERLKRGRHTIADSFDEATVLFADIANFTELAAPISPIEIVALLNQIFSAFDTLAEQHGLEKIKTIGDAYMVVGGLPKPRPDHVLAIADMALALQQSITKFRIPPDKSITLRIGIHTGPVVAGIIGTKKFIYDLWGDTVNVASRMESQGEAGRIQVSADVYERLKKRYDLEPRGTIAVKGKGDMQTYWLKGRKDWFC
jgi:PAS domain S-box-containing protein